MFLEIIAVIAGIYQIIFGLIMNTENFLSALLFKIIPFLLGVCLLIGGGFPLVQPYL